MWGKLETLIQRLAANSFGEQALLWHEIANANTIYYDNGKKDGAEHEISMVLRDIQSFVADHPPTSTAFLLAHDLLRRIEERRAGRQQ